MFVDEEEEDDAMGPTWQMEDIQGGSLFTRTYQTAAASTLPTATLRTAVEYGNKIVMPASALDTLSRLNIMYPMMFRVRAERTGRSTHCGVLEFSAPEGVVYLPSWMLKGMQIGVGELVTLTNVALPVGSFIEIQPQSIDFLDITDPRAVLEHSLRNFATLTEGDCVAISYNERIYELLVLKVRPQDGRGGISVLETDLQVDFAPPLGYQEPTTYSPPVPPEKSIAGSLDLSAHVLSTSAHSSSISGSFAPFSGTGQRLSQRARPAASSASQEISGERPIDPAGQSPADARGPAPLALPKGTMFFASSRKPPLPSSLSSPSPSPSPSSAAAAKETAVEAREDASKSKPFGVFSGQPRKLR